MLAEPKNVLDIETFVSLDVDRQISDGNVAYVKESAESMHMHELNELYLEKMATVDKFFQFVIQLVAHFENCVFEY